MQRVAEPAKTRQQNDLLFAITCINEVQRAFANAPKAQKIYGGLCHKLPILVRTCGLCQTIAFIEDKASKNDDRGEAYKRLRSHISRLLDVPATTDLVATVRDSSLQDYLRQTRRILSAWVYFKRFAVSVLKVQSGQEVEE